MIESQTANVIGQQHDLLLFKAVASFKNQVKNSILHGEFDEVLGKINLLWGFGYASLRQLQLSLIYYQRAV